MPLPEVKAWSRYARSEPFGPAGDDARLGALALLVANFSRGKGATVTIDKLFPWIGKPQQSDDDIAEAMFGY